VPRGDGRLSHDLIPGEKGPQDACGVFGVWAPGEDVAKLTYYGLYALQHRGQESAGIATSDGQRLLVYKDMGLVSQVFDERSLASLRGPPRSRATAATPPPAARRGRTPSPPSAATPVAPWRWPTTATSRTPPNCVTSSRAGSRGHPPRASWAGQHHRHRARHGAAGRPPRPHPRGCGPRRAAPTARRVLLRLHERTHLVCRPRPPGHPPARPRSARTRLGRRLRDGCARHRRRLLRARDRARRDAHRSTRTGCARSASPKDPQGLRLRVRLPGTSRHDDQRPVVHEPRVEMGRALAREHPIEADLVMPTPESGTPAAIGYAQESGIPYGQGLVKNCLCRAHLHRALADDPPARHPAQAQPAA
jgi:amidophosphoribosyltransferase